MQNKKVAIVMGSDSDWSVVKSACGAVSYTHLTLPTIRLV